MGRGGFNPVISDGRTIFLTGYSSLYALRPAKKNRPHGKPAAAQRRP